MYTKRNLTPKSYNRLTKGLVDKTFSTFYQGTPVDEFTVQRNHPSHSRCESVRISSEVYMLFNQNRLDRMTLEALVNRLNDIQPSDDHLASIRNKMSDEQLMSFIKSRYIQTPSELMAYYNYLESEAGILEAEIADKNRIAAEEFQRAIKVDQVDSAADSVENL